MGITYLFPGQGAQKVGMGADLYDTFDTARARFDAAGEILGRDLKKLCFEGPAEELTATQNTQPALFTVESALFDVLKERRLAPSLVLGHSLGEYGALYASGLFSFEEGLRIVAKRGELMAQAGERAPGSMAAVIGLSKEDIKSVIAGIDGTVVTANENSPEQTVISGEVEAVKEAGAKLKEAGAKRVVPLPVSGAFHSPLMQPVAEEFAEFISPFEFMEPECPVVSNVTATPLTDAGELKELMVKQLVSPVRWVESMAMVEEEGLTTCAEVGPGAVLRGLARKSGDRLNVVPCETVENVYSLVDSMKQR